MVKTKSLKNICMESTNARSNQEFNQYEKGLDRKLWKYLRFAGLQEKKFRQKYIKFLLSRKEIKKLKVLELGSSKWTEIIHDLFEEEPEELICINISPSEINLAKEEAEKLLTRYKPIWIEMDAHNLDFKDNYFDLVIGYGMLHHLELDIVLNEIKRVLKSDGLALFREPLDINPILTLARFLTPKARTTEEVPFKKIHLKKIVQIFPETEIFFEQFLTFIISPIFNFLPQKFIKTISAIIYKFDQLLLRTVPSIGYFFRSIFIVIKKTNIIEKTVLDTFISKDG